MKHKNEPILWISKHEFPFKLERNVTWVRSQVCNEFPFVDKEKKKSTLLW